MSTPQHWTMKDVQIHLHAILLADHPLTQDQRKALKACIEMCDVWNKISPGFAKVADEYRQKGLLPTNQEQAIKHELCRACGQSRQNHEDGIGGARDCVFQPVM